MSTEAKETRQYLTFSLDHEMFAIDVIKAREIQASRKDQTGALINQELSSNAISNLVNLDKSTMDMLELASKKMQLSNRAYYRILKLARTIADLEGAEDVGQSHVAEALQYRRVVDSS